MLFFIYIQIAYFAELFLFINGQRVTITPFAPCVNSRIGATFCDRIVVDPNNPNGPINNCASTNIVTCTVVTGQGAAQIMNPVPCADRNDGANPFCFDTTNDPNGNPPNSIFTGRADCSRLPMTVIGTMNAVCTLPPINYFCTRVGVMPDPSNCRKYYVCTRAETVATSQFFCPANYAFDPSLPDEFPCRFTKGNSAYCITASCGSPLFRYPYFNTALGQFGVSCANPMNPTVFRCSAYSTFSSDANQVQTCTGQCSYDGQRFANIVGGHQSYTVCALNAAANAYIEIIRTCPGDSTYNAKTNECDLDVTALRAIVNVVCPPNAASPIPEIANLCPPRM